MPAGKSEAKSGRNRAWQAFCYSCSTCLTRALSPWPGKLEKCSPDLLGRREKYANLPIIRAKEQREEDENFEIRLSFGLSAKPGESWCKSVDALLAVPNCTQLALNGLIVAPI